MRTRPALLSAGALLAAGLVGWLVGAGAGSAFFRGSGEGQHQPVSADGTLLRLDALALLTWPTPAPTPAPTPTEAEPPSPPPESPPVEAQPEVAADDPPPAPPPPAQPVAAVEVAAQLLAGINAERAVRGLQPLAVDGVLAASASAYTETMARAGTASHSLDGQTLGERIRAAGFGGSPPFGEVLWVGSASFAPGDVVGAWLNSPGHSVVILSPDYALAGVGCFISGPVLACAVQLAA